LATTTSKKRSSSVKNAKETQNQKTSKGVGKEIPSMGVLARKRMGEKVDTVGKKFAAKG